MLGMNPSVATELGGAGMAVSGLALLAQAAELPGLPDGFESWPVTAMLAAIALASMFLCWKVFAANIAQASKAADAAMKQAEALAAMTMATGETNRRLDEVATKLGRTNDEMAATRVQLQNRPCIMHGSQQ